MIDGRLSLPSSNWHSDALLRWSRSLLYVRREASRSGGGTHGRSQRCSEWREFARSPAPESGYGPSLTGTGTQLAFTSEKILHEAHAGGSVPVQATAIFELVSTSRLQGARPYVLSLNDRDRYEARFQAHFRAISNRPADPELFTRTEQRHMPRSFGNRSLTEVHRAALRGLGLRLGR